MQLTTGVWGNGFDIAIRNVSRRNIMFTVYESDSNKFARVYANVSATTKAMHLAFVYQKTENYIAVYVNGVEADRVSFIQTLHSRGFEFGTDRVLLMGQDICPSGELTPYTYREMRLWRYPLRHSIVRNLYRFGKSLFIFSICFIINFT